MKYKDKNIPRWLHSTSMAGKHFLSLRICKSLNPFCVHCTVHASSRKGLIEVKTATFKYPLGLSLLNSRLMDWSATKFRSSRRPWAAFSGPAACSEDWEYTQEELNTKHYFSIHFEYWFKEIKSKPPISLVSNQYLIFGRSEMFSQTTCPRLFHSATGF